MGNIQDMVRYSKEICIAQDQGLYPLLPFILFPYFAFLIIINRELFYCFYTHSANPTLTLNLNFGDRLWKQSVFA